MIKLVSFVLFCLSFSTIWILISSILAFVSGWNSLSKLYKDTRSYGEFDSTFSSKSIQLNTLGSYMNSINIGLNREGLHLQPTFVFPFFHPPLFIPFYKIHKIVETKEFLWIKCIDIYFDSSKIRMYGKPAKAIKKIVEEKKYYTLGEKI